VVLFPTSLTTRDVIVAGTANLLTLPTSASPREIAIFPLNGPFWSLFFEFWVANLLFGLMRNHLSTKVLFSLIGLSAACLLITEKIFHSVNLGVSWYDFGGGFGRVIFSFFTGVALAQYRERTPSSLPAWAPVVALPLLLSVPIEGRIAHLYELACVLIIFPAFLHFSSQAKERYPWVGNALGDASYALYTIHYPLPLILMPMATKTFGLSTGLPLQLGFVALVAPIGWLLSFADIRFRKWLKPRLLHLSQPTAGRAALQTRVP
jgi:peptidoglycan/LPS O-acetylase OafA/YrhL